MLDVDPFAGAAARRACVRSGRTFLHRVDGVDTQRSDGIATAENGTNIVGIVDVFKNNGQIWLAQGEDMFDSLLSTTRAGEALCFCRIGGQRLTVDRAHLDMIRSDFSDTGRSIS